MDDITPALALLCRIEDASPQELDAHSRHVLAQARQRELPATLRAYLALTPAARQRLAQQGQGAEELLREQLELISQGVCLPGIPRHPTYAGQRQWLLERMALAFRSFARKGYTDGMAGHISVRDPENPHTFWTVSGHEPRMAPSGLHRGRIHWPGTLLC